jgi:hypothetical protein
MKFVKLSTSLGLTGIVALLLLAYCTSHGHLVLSMVCAMVYGVALLALGGMFLYGIALRFRKSSINAKLWKASLEAHELARKWERQGVIVTIERAPRQPLAMGNNVPRVVAWAKRGSE